MDHLTRVQVVIDFIEDHLREPLRMEQLAHMGGLSVWYFQRIFRGVVGETVADYVRLRRLSCALAELQSTNRRILDVALDYQFEEAASFTRAFRAAFGMPPAMVRRQRPTLIPPGKRRITPEYLDHLYSGVSLQPKFVMLPRMKVVGISTHYINILSDESDAEVVVPALRQAFQARLEEISGRRNPAAFFGVFMPLREGQKKHPDEWQYMACAEVEEGTTPPSGMEPAIISGGRYGLFTHRGTLERIQHTYNYIYGAWLPRSGQALREAPEIELYDQRFKPEAKDLELDLYVPVM